MSWAGWLLTGALLMGLFGALVGDPASLGAWLVWGAMVLMLGAIAWLQRVIREDMRLERDLFRARQAALDSLREPVKAATAAETSESPRGPVAPH